MANRGMEPLLAHHTDPGLQQGCSKLLTVEEAAILPAPMERLAASCMLVATHVVDHASCWSRMLLIMYVVDYACC